jgi:glycosyltransferase involved in cell wall biosynthesis
MSSIPPPLISGASEPLISIVTPSYNQGRFLETAIRSVVEQDYPHVEHVIIDGGSTDGSVDIIRAHEKHLAYWISEPDRGQSHALNKGLDRCRGTLLGWLNADDYFRPGALRAFAGAWRHRPDAGAWVGRADIVDAAGRLQSVVAPRRLDRDGIADWTANGFSQPACLFSRQAWDTCRPIDESLFIPMDVDFWLKIAAVLPLIPLDATVATATSHPEAKTKAHVNLRDAELWIVQVRHGYEALARQRMLERLGRDDELRRKVGLLTTLPGYALARPFARALLGSWAGRRDRVPGAPGAPSIPAGVSASDGLPTGGPGP